jgi:hypothetical protein
MVADNQSARTTMLNRLESHVKTTMLGRTKLHVPRIAFGTWQLGGDWGQFDEDAPVSTIRPDCQQGVLRQTSTRSRRS